MKQMNKVKVLRLTSGMTQQDIADILGITRQAYSAKENGKYSFNDSEKKILKELFLKVDDGLTIDKLFF